MRKWRKSQQKPMNTNDNNCKDILHQSSFLYIFLPQLTQQNDNKREKMCIETIKITTCFASSNIETLLERCLFRFQCRRQQNTHTHTEKMTGGKRIDMTWHSPPIVLCRQHQTTSYHRKRFSFHNLVVLLFFFMFIYHWNMERLTVMSEWL